jgi:tetratricopeptide (TPR) repeat protein
MLEFYERYAHQNESGDRLRSETASAYRRVGEIERRMGRPDRAEQALRRALGIYDALTRGTSDRGDYRVEQAAVCNELGLALRELGRFPESRTDGFARALELVDGNESPAAKFQAIRAHLVLGRQITPQRPRYWQWGWWAQPDVKPKATPQAEEAERHLRQALQLAEFFVGHSPGNPSFELALAESHANLAFLLLRLDQIEEGLAHDRAALDILEQRVQGKPADPLCRQKLAETLVLAVGYGRTPLSVEDKRSRLDKARRIAEQLIDERPDYPEYRVLLAKTQVRQAAVLGSIGDRKGANGLLDQSMTLLEDLAERYPRSPQFAFLLATTLIATSGATGSAEELESSRGRLERALLILEKLSKEYPTATRWAKPYLDRAEQRLRRVKQSRDRDQAGTRKNPTGELFNVVEH